MAEKLKITPGKWFAYPANEDRIELDGFELFDIHDEDGDVICEGVCGFGNASAIVNIPALIEAAEKVCKWHHAIKICTPDNSALSLEKCLQDIEALRAALNKIQGGDRG